MSAIGFRVLGFLEGGVSGGGGAGGGGGGGGLGFRRVRLKVSIGV